MITFCGEKGRQRAKGSKNSKLAHSCVSAQQCAHQLRRRYVKNTSSSLYLFFLLRTLLNFFSRCTCPHVSMVTPLFRAQCLLLYSTNDLARQLPIAGGTHKPIVMFKQIHNLHILIKANAHLPLRLHPETL